jgi:hypothetical protein
MNRLAAIRTEFGGLFLAGVGIALFALVGLGTWLAMLTTI